MFCRLTSAKFERIKHLTKVELVDKVLAEESLVPKSILGLDIGSSVIGVAIWVPDAKMVRNANVFKELQC